MSAPFHIENIAGVAHLRLNRPEKLNAMSRDFWTELPRIVRELSDDGAARCIVISSTGRHFCSGMDLSVFSTNAQLSADSKEDPQIENEAFRHLVKCRIVRRHRAKLPYSDATVRAS